VQNGDGEHTLTVRVSPDDLGPVTVKAHISGSSVSIELASGTAAGRDALRALLSDLRRDLAVLVPHSSVAVTTADAGRGDQASSGSGSSSAWAGLAQSGTGSGSGAGAGSGPGSGQSGQPPSGQPSSERSSERNAAAATALDPSLSRSQRDATGIDVFA
jgi:flagellar hook-length control protein FliK